MGATGGLKRGKLGNSCPERLELKNGEGGKAGKTLIIISLVVLFGFKIRYIYYFGKRIQFN